MWLPKGNVEHFLSGTRREGEVAMRNMKKFDTYGGFLYENSEIK